MDVETRKQVEVLAREQDGVLLRRQALPAGVSPSGWRSALRSEWVPLLAGVAYLPDLACGRPLEPGPRSWARAALLVAGPGAVLGHGSVLRMLGVEGTPVGDPEHVHTSGPRHRQREGVRLHWTAVPAHAVHPLDGLPATSLGWALRDVSRAYDREHLVSVIDSAAHRRLLPASALSSMAAWGLSAERLAWLRLVDDRSESPFETRSRLLFLGAGLGPLESQVRVWLPGYGLARLDHLLAGVVVIESDGRAAHDGPSAAYRDRRRHEALEAAGFVVVRVTWDDVVRRPAETLRRVLAALARSRAANVRVRVETTPRLLLPLAA